jgi:hypothetical protein
MNDDWLDRRLRVVDERVSPDPSFATHLYGELTSELGLDGRVHPRTAPTGRAPGRSRPARRWWLLLVAAVLVGAVATAAVVGGLVLRHPSTDALIGPAPHVCALISPSELSAVVGAPATLTVPESASSSSAFSATSCVYEFKVDAAITPNVILSITRYAGPSEARAQLQPGIVAHGLITGLGDAATYVVPGPATGVMVLAGSDVLLVGGIGSSVDLAQAEAIARIILGRL